MKWCFLHAEPIHDESHSYKHLDDARVGEGSCDRVSSDTTIEVFSRMSDQVFIGETEARFVGVIGEFSVGENRGSFVVKEDSV
jgi:hypothetical protein